MYDRAPRAMTQTIGSTNHAIGPGSYNVEATSKTRIKMDAYAPFGSLVERTTGLIDEEQVVSVPGPGYYDGILTSTKSSKQGGASLGFTSKRFNDVKNKIPGPGYYDLYRPISDPDIKSKSAPTLRTSRIKFYRNQEPPSIPVPRQAYGYEESDSGMLVKQAPPENDGSIGPAFYSVPREDYNRTTKKYKGTSFGKSTAKRSEFLPTDRDLPGPGTYDTNIEKKYYRENLNVARDTDAKHEAPQTLRFTEEVIKREEKEKLPGPGQYSLHRAFETTKNKPDVEHAPFGSQTKRFPSKFQAIPGPGSYNDPRSALDSLKRVTGLKRSPFGQTSMRFSQNGDGLAPGPGAYNTTDGIGQVTMRKLVMESARKGAFGSTAARGQAFAKSDEFNMPGPADYAPKERPYGPRYNALSSMFSSMSSRFDESSAEVEQPAPGSYDVARSYNKLFSQATPKAPQNEDARKRRFAPGASAAGRTSLNKIDEYVPAPGAYDVATAAAVLTSRNGGVTISKSARFKPVKNEAPGPGAYTLAPSVRDSVWKSTFNITLGSSDSRTVAPGSVSMSVSAAPALTSSKHFDTNQRSQIASS